MVASTLPLEPSGAPYPHLNQRAPSRNYDRNLHLVSSLFNGRWEMGNGRGCGVLSDGHGDELSDLLPLFTTRPR